MWDETLREEYIKRIWDSDMDNIPVTFIYSPKNKRKKNKYT